MKNTAAVSVLALAVFATLGASCASHAHAQQSALAPQAAAEGTDTPAPIPTPTTAPTPAPLPTSVPSGSPSAGPSASPAAPPPPATPSPLPTATSAPLTTPVPTPTPIVVPMLPPGAPPEIVSLSLAPNVAHAGQVVSGVVYTSSNVASVVAHVANVQMPMQKAGVGRFTLSYTVPRLPFFLHRTWNIQVTAYNAAGVKTSSSIPITIR